MKEIKLNVHGRVQGVRFRENIRKFADSLGLKGFVANKKDGGVFILVQGKKSNLDKFVSYIQAGPGFAKLEGLNYKKGDVEKEYPDFRIVREKSFLVDKAESLLSLGKYYIKGKERVPRHVAIIPDGNRRWAKNKGLDGTFGHYKAGSYDSVDSLFKEAKKLGIKCFSIWGFSTENWKRSKKEQDEIFNLILNRTKRFLKEAEKNKIKFRHVGRKDRLPEKLVENLKKLEEVTKKYDDFSVQICLDYGGRDEIVRAVNKALKSGKRKVDEKTFEKFLDTDGIEDPELIIRTSGERRLSGFFPYQGVYSELYFSDLMFPDFTGKELRKAVKEFGRRQRRFGGN